MRHQGRAQHAEHAALPLAAAQPKHAPATRPWTTFLPLLLVLGIAMVKEAVEDYKRYRQDVEVNNRQVEVRWGRRLG
jgi:hypothetical protein